MPQSVFNRYEKKNLMPETVYQELRVRLSPYMQVDSYGLHIEAERNKYGSNLVQTEKRLQAHGGSLSVRDRTPHGSVFCIDVAREALTDKPEGENPA